MATLDVTKKLRIYHILYRMNRSFATIVMQCRALEEAGLFKTKVTRRYQGFTQELQAEINGELLDTLHSTELREWYHFGKIRQNWEKQLRGPDDSFRQGTSRKTELRKKESH